MEDTDALPLPSRTLFLFERLRCIERKICYVTLPWKQNCWISTNSGPAKMAEKRENIDMYVFPVHMIALRTNTVAHATIQWPSHPTKFVEIHNFCYNGSVTSHVSSLLPRRSSGASVNIPQQMQEYFSVCERPEETFDLACTFSCFIYSPNLVNTDSEGTTEVTVLTGVRIRRFIY